MASITEFVKNELGADQSGHNFQHAERVAKLSQEIAKKEKGDERICLAAAWLHDCVDEKLFKDTATQEAKVRDVLRLNGYNEGEIAEIMDILATISFHKEKDHPLTKRNAKIVSDADKLEAIGAIGIIRTIEYGTSKGRPFYENENLEEVDGHYQFKQTSETTISHFYEKLLRLGEHFYTRTGKKMAERRLRFLRAFLEEFYKELSE
jgi:uncharacterized protein